MKFKHKTLIMALLAGLSIYLIGYSLSDTATNPKTGSYASENQETCLNLNTCILIRAMSEGKEAFHDTLITDGEYGVAITFDTTINNVTNLFTLEDGLVYQDSECRSVVLKDTYQNDHHVTYETELIGFEAGDSVDYCLIFTNDEERLNLLFVKQNL